MLSLWIVAAIAVAQHLGLCPKPHIPVWAAIRKKIIAVGFSFGMSYNCVKLSKKVCALYWVH